MKNNLTDRAIEGFNCAEGLRANPYLYSSPSWYAFELGLWLHKTGRTIPRLTAMSRGYTIRSNDMLFRIIDDVKTISFERIR